MDTTLTPIGNSKGIRIPAVICKQLAFNDKQKLRLSVEGEQLIIRKVKTKKSAKKKHPRAGWSAMAKRAGKEPLTREELDWLNVPHEWDETEWTW